MKRDWEDRFASHLQKCYTDQDENGSVGSKGKEKTDKRGKHRQHKENRERKNKAEKSKTNRKPIRKKCLNITKNSRKNHKKNVAKFVEMVYSKRTRQSMAKPYKIRLSRYMRERKIVAQYHVRTYVFDAIYSITMGKLVKL